MLQKNEVVNTLILGFAFNLVKDLNYYGKQMPVLLSVLDQGLSKYCCVQTPPNNLIIYGDMDALDQATRSLCDYLTDSKLEFPGVIGSKEVSQRFAETWSSAHALKWRLKMNMMVYKLDEVNEMEYGEGQLRQAAHTDLDTISDWVLSFNSEIFEGITEVEAKEMANRRITNKEIYVWEDGELLSMAACCRPTKNGITINYVFTPRHLRKRGLASNCVAALSRLLLTKYKFCTLFADLENPTSNKIYKKIGYKEICEFQEHEFYRIENAI